MRWLIQDQRSSWCQMWPSVVTWETLKLLLPGSPPHRLSSNWSGSFCDAECFKSCPHHSYMQPEGWPLSQVVVNQEKNPHVPPQGPAWAVTLREEGPGFFCISQCHGKGEITCPPPRWLDILSMVFSIRFWFFPPFNHNFLMPALGSNNPQFQQTLEKAEHFFSQDQQLRG